MSDTILFGVLRMPYEMAMADEMSRHQFWQRAQEAADLLQQLEAKQHETDAGYRDNNWWLGWNAAIRNQNAQKLTAAMTGLMASAVPAIPEGMALVQKDALEMILHKFERAGGPWKVANFGVALGASSWASNVENALTALAAAAQPPAAALKGAKP